MIRARRTIVISLCTAAIIVCAESLYAFESLAESAKPRVITGRVTNPEGEGLAGATVEWGPRRYYRFKRRERTITDSEGHYSLTLKEFKQPCQLRAYLPGYLPEDIMSAMENKRTYGDFVLSPTPATGHAAFGVVVDEHGEPIPDVKVEAFTPVVGFHSSFSMPRGRDYFAGPDRIVSTDSHGRFRIADLPKTENGEVHLSLRSKHRHINDANYPIGEKVRIVMHGSGKPGVLQGQLFDAETNKPIPITKDLRIIRRHRTKVHRFSSDSGKFQLPDQVTLNRKYLVYIYAPGYEAKVAKLLAVENDAEEFTDIPLSKKPSLRGKLLDADTGAPINAAALLYGVGDESNDIAFSWGSFGKFTDGYLSYSFVQRDKTDEDGNFWFAEPAANSRGTIFIWSKGYQRMILKNESREVDEKTGELVIRVKPESAFQGTVTKNGIALANVSVSASGQPLNGFYQSFGSVLTDENGRYRLGCLPPGNYHLNGGGYSRRATVGESETTTLDLGAQMGAMRIHGKAVSKVTINLTPDFDWEYRRFVTTADSEGKYEFYGLKAGKYRISFHFPYSGGYISRDEREITVKYYGQQIDFSQPIAGRVALESTN